MMRSLGLNKYDELEEIRLSGVKLEQWCDKLESEVILS